MTRSSVYSTRQKQNNKIRTPLCSYCLLIFALLIGAMGKMNAQNNPYRLNDEVYSYYQKCLKQASEPIVVSMADTMNILSKRNHDLKGQCIAMNLKTRYYLTIDNIDSIRYHKKLVQQFAEQTPHTAYVFSAWNCVIQYYLNKRDFDAALKEAYQYDAEAHRIKSKYGIGQSFRVLGTIYENLGNYDVAIEYYQKGADYYKANNDPNLYECYNSICHCYLILQQYDKVENYAELSLENCNVQTLQTSATIFIARAAINQKNVMKATGFIQKLESMHKQMVEFFPSNEISYAEVQVEYNLMMNRPEEAKKWLLHLIDTNSEYKYKGMYYEAIGDFKNALAMQQKSMVLNDSLKDNTSHQYHELARTRIEILKLKNSETQLQLANTHMKLKEMDAKHRFLILDREHAAILLRSKNLELSNQRAMVAQHRMEAKRLLDQSIILQMKADKNKTIVLFLISVGALLMAFFLIIVISYRRYTRNLIKHNAITEQALKEKERALAAEDEALKAKEEALLAEHKAKGIAEAALEKARQADRMKSVFLQNMSHDMRTPLGAIAGFNDLLNGNDEMQLGEEDKKEMLKMIHMNVDLITALLNDVLDISKLENGTYQINIGTFSVADLCMTSAESVRQRVPEGVELRCIIPEAYKDLSVDTDGQRVAQVINNFLTNACKYTKAGSITLTYDLIERSGERIVEFRVADTGCGIPSELSQTIFNRFEMLGSKKNGTGLGLNICKCIADLFHGKVYLDTEYKEGARFVFELPILLR